MSGIPASPTNRAMLDANALFSVTGPNAATGANGTLFDLAQVNAFPINERFDLQVVIPAMPNNTSTAANSGVTLTLVDSADSNTSNGVAIAGLATIVIAGVASTGSVAVTKYVKLPGATREFIGVQSSGGANSGDNSAKTITVNLTF